MSAARMALLVSLLLTLAGAVGAAPPAAVSSATPTVAPLAAPDSPIAASAISGSSGVKAPSASAEAVAPALAPALAPGAIDADAEAAPLGVERTQITGVHASSYPLTSIPLDKGLPVVVRAGMYFADVSEIDDNEGAFGATVDLRLRWQDLRLSYEPTLAPSGFKEFRAQDADAKLAEIWSPDIHLDNLVGDPTFERKGLRLFPDGSVELIVRTAGSFESSFEVENFPFDRQSLTVEVVSQRDTQDKVTLDFRQHELDFSKLAPTAKTDGWTLGLVDIRRAVQAGWYGQQYSKIEVSLGAARLPGGSAAAIFIPLLASLLIPLLAMWLNKLSEAEFQVEAFELTNIIIGGLFAVIALNFTVNSEYQMLSGDNTVSRLFVLNYVTLGVSLLINLLLFRFNVVARCCGKYVQEQLYVFLVWSVPTLVAITAGAVLLTAIV